MTPEEWRRRAAELDAQAKAANEAGDVEKALELALSSQGALRIAEELERAAKETDLRKGARSVILSAMLSAARVRIAKGSTRDRKVDPLRVVASAAGHTVRSLAEGLGISNVYLTLARRGERSIRESRAKAIQEMTRSKEYPTGFAATRANWPGGWAREPDE